MTRFFYFSRANPWTVFFHGTHIFELICVIGVILLAYLTSRSEEQAVGKFHLNITSVAVILFYSFAALMVATIITGEAAQQFAEKPSVWIVYCILLTVCAMVMFTASMGATLAATRTHKHKALMNFQISMEYYSKNSTNGTRWDELQTNYKCCGVESYKDWQDVQFGRTSLRVPKSCCRPPNNTDDYCGLNILPHKDNADDYIYAEGCNYKALRDIRAYLTILGISGLIVSVLTLIASFVACYGVVTKKV